MTAQLIEFPRKFIEEEHLGAPDVPFPGQIVLFGGRTRHAIRPIYPNKVLLDDGQIVRLTQLRACYGD